MKSFLLSKQWNWKASSVALALCFLLAVMLVKPIGVSTQFVIFDGIVWDFFDNEFVKPVYDSESTYTSKNAYINKNAGKYARSIAEPLNYSFVFVLSMIAGGFLAKLLTKERQNNKVNNIPDVWVDRFGTSSVKRYTACFIGGLLVLFGARLAGGCTSGHMMSGMMQTALSGYLFTVAVFMVAVPCALLIYARKC